MVFNSGHYDEKPRFHADQYEFVEKGLAAEIEQISDDHWSSIEYEWWVSREKAYF